MTIQKKQKALIREFVRSILLEGFPIYAKDKLRIHHSRPGTRVDDKPQISGFTQKVDRKPNGLWYECQDGSAMDWKAFCETGLSDGYSKYDGTYNVILKDKGYNILHITDEYYFDKFVKKYSVPHPVFPDDREEDLIDWPKVAEAYSGIEICPYLHKKRDVMWYYGWDVASGCIWDADGVEDLVKAGDCK